MPLLLYWFLPSHGDGRAIARVAGDGAQHAARASRREPDIGYLAQVAAAADRLGFAGALVPAGLFCEDAWLVSAALAAQTSRLKFMVALRPGLVSPPLVAQMAATAQRITGNRMLLNVVTGSDPDEQRRYGDWLDHDRRYERADEFLSVLRGAWSGDPFDFTGEHYRVAGARVARPAPPPALFLGGSSAAAQRVAARHVDVYLAWGEPPDRMAPLLRAVREQAAEQGRQISFGTRFHVIARDTAAEAWAEADRLLAGMDPGMVAAAQRRFQATESEGQRRMAALHGGRADRLEVYPNIWAGYGLLRPGAGAALVGSHEQVAERIEELSALGVEHLILSGQPHLEEAYWFGEGVMPLLARSSSLVAG
ncbi:LLM class flavin-dependent oxidoreductase [Micromonospora sp. CPCC 206061]|uniref:LLM class flavin-dependent oxidoreductase n=1 Tax=Micromonospora sp. CPCC 206061 TaxID=3122410 RepID=UPI002FEF5C6A